jgi:hypothetical protein
VSCFSGPALGFDWEQGSSDAPIQDDPALEDYNVQQRVFDFIFDIFVQHEAYGTV